jgi:hypothetical protein
MAFEFWYIFIIIDLSIYQSVGTYFDFDYLFND